MVAPLTQGDAWEVFDIVGGVEGLAGRLAAARGERERAELSSRLEEVNARLQSETEKNRMDRGLLFELDTEFHCAAFEVAAGRRLMALHAAIEPQADRD